MTSKFKANIFKLLIVGMVIFCSYKILSFSNSVPRALSFENSPKTVTIDDDGLIYSTSSQVDTVGDFLKEKNVSLSARDQVIPDKNSPLLPDMTIEIRRAKQIKILVDGKTISAWTLSQTVGQALAENKVTLFRLDKTTPDLNAPVGNDTTITVTRINVEDVTENVPIPFQTVTDTDATLGWRETNITTPGQPGVKEIKYQITYKNGAVVSKVALSSSIVKPPVTQVQTKGTYVKVGKGQTGEGTWYSYISGLYAASLTIPRGAYARVTNLANGESVIVQINDSGPYGKGRIIDLDKVAFEKIADIGAGVVNVKVEPVLN